MIYSHLASRVFGVPLLIERQKLDVILSAIGSRVGVDVQAAGPGDTASKGTKRGRAPIRCARWSSTSRSPKTINRAGHGCS